MKNFTFVLLAVIFMLAGLTSSAQLEGYKSSLQRSIINRQTQGAPQRNCPTFELMEKAFQADPGARLRYANTQQLLQQKEQQYRANREQRIEAIISVPVVVHVLLPAAQQALVTDAIIQTQIDTLNFYYGGSPFNSDSLRVYDPFRDRYGRSDIRFCMAQRTPTNLPTTGINRVVTSTIYDGTNTPGNVIVWDPTKYLNIWVVNAGNSGLLGYSYTPGSWAPADPHQGFVNDYRAFGSGPGTSAGGFHYNEYNQGKTAVHEIGHYFNLYHPWGPNNSGNPSCTLSDLCNDTPPCVGPFFGCPGPIPVLDACSSAAPGVMWQNHMDYADDRCMVLFTKDQCTRMMTAINNAPDRVGLLTSNGCQAPPPPAGLDARISAIISPISGSNIGCSSVTPVVTIMNMGSTVLTSATINIRLNGALAGTQAWTGSLAQGGTANVTLVSVPVPLGANTLKIHTTLPNGLGDAVPSNDTATAVFTRVAASAIPVTNDFETALTPAGWTVSNPNSDALAWVRAAGGAGGSAFAAKIDNYNQDFPGTFDDIITPVVNTSGVAANDSVQLSFDLAYKNYPDPGFYDSLKVMVTTNCGATWTTIWARGGPTLATAGSSTADYAAPAQGDWKTQKVSIGTSIFSAGQVQFVFRNVNFFGNELWLDNINVAIKPKKDLSTTAILRPNLTECSGTFAPSITVRNVGGEAVTGFKTGYILNNGAPVLQAQNISLAVGASTTVTFPNLTAPVGVNTIKLFVTDPLSASSGPDAVPVNDTLVRTFFVPSPATVPSVTEGFEGATFPPANWFRINSDNSITWQRTTPGKSSAYSAFVDNYNYATNVYLFDYLQPPPINTTGADSLIITFDYANQYWTDGIDTSVDNLSVLVSKNCSASFTTVFSKTGTDLATAGGGPDPYLNPAPSDWRTVRLAVDMISAPASSTIVQFRNADAYGNNTFIDNINIVPQFKRDIEVVSVTPDVVCGTAYAPVATVRNRGTETITGYKIAYTVGTGAPILTTITGVTIAPNATATVTLGAGTLANGVNNIKVFTYEPTTASGTGDQFVANDTLVKATYASATPVPAPLVETFEGTFLPTGWAISNPDNSITWQKATTGRNSLGSAYMRNFVYLSANGSKDLLYSPVVSFTGVDSVLLAFDLSAATRASPSAAVPMDTLEVLVTRDCGNTYTSVYKKWGAALQTVLDPVSPLPSEFVPFADYLWRTELIDLSSFRPSGPLQVVFKNSSNGGNNIYIDNVNFRTRTLPQRLRTDGVVIMPSPFANQFNIWYVQAPADLRYVSVFNTAGQLMYKRVFPSGSTANVIPVDLTSKAAGIYIVYLGYSDKSKDKQLRIIKANE